jgi:hypothetical protein
MFLFVIIALCNVARVDAARTLGEGSDLEIGGAGTAPGQFLELRDFTFDAQNNLYSLDGLRRDLKTGAIVGNARVQKFDGQGTYNAQFSVRNEALGTSTLGDKNDPQRIAVSRKGINLNRRD